MELNQRMAMVKSCRDIAEIISRIHELEAHLVFIEEAMSREQNKPFFERRKGLYLFLDMERKMYASMLKELKWVIDG